jgi:hypothetical protein
MSTRSRENIKELRRRVRAPYRIEARLEIPGLTPRQDGMRVYIIDANEWGVRLESACSLPRIPVILTLRAPDGSTIRTGGWVIHSAQSQVERWEGGIEFDTPQPALSTARIDHANAMM